nr:hypothetical protein [Treponema sp.]
ESQKNIFNQSFYESFEFYSMPMKTLKPTIYITLGQMGSGKTNVLFKLCEQKFRAKLPEEKMVFISANFCTLGQNQICQKFCEIIKIPFIPRVHEELKDFPFEQDTTYFIDFGSVLMDQKYIYDYFNSGKFNFNPLFTIPAFMDFSVAENTISLFNNMTSPLSPKVLLTFCDYVKKAKVRDFEGLLNKLNVQVIGFNMSAYLHRGLIMKHPDTSIDDLDFE